MMSPIFWACNCVAAKQEKMNKKTLNDELHFINAGFNVSNLQKLFVSVIRSYGNLDYNHHKRMETSMTKYSVILHDPNQIICMSWHKINADRTSRIVINGQHIIH